jgi:alpha-galactosidase
MSHGRKRQKEREDAMPAKSPLKVSIIGGGSISWGPVFLKDLCASEAARGGTLCLYDLSVPSLDGIARFAEKLFAERGADLRIVTTTDFDEALQGADYVVNTVLVGSQAVWKKELDLIRSYGIAHPKGMSVGPGGMMMGLKQIPFVIDLAQRMARLCPDAWLLNFANPMQLNILAIQRFVPQLKSIGLCHGLDHTIEKIAGRLGIPMEEISWTAGGVNHFESVIRMEHEGKDLFPRFIAQLEADAKREYTGEAITLELYRIFGVWPSNHDIHVIEFLPYYIRKGTRLEDWNQSYNDVDGRIADKADQWRKAEDYIAGRLPLSGIVKEKVSEKLGEIIDATTSNRPFTLYANVTNRGYIPNLSRNIAVGVPVIVDRGGWQGVCIGELPQGIAALHNLHGAVQDLVLRGAVEGSRKALLEALSLDPMCYTLTVEERTRLIDDLLQIDRAMLPRFFS